LNVFILTAVFVLVLACGLGGCGKETKSLQLRDLTSGERRYIERFITLERARAVALVDSKLGSTLLDSLATAWGDSSLAETRRGLSNNPQRAAAVHDLLLRILDAERDSLVQVPSSRRLTAPLPDPPPATDSS
jgi:hypothetical protein